MPAAETLPLADAAHAHRLAEAGGTPTRAPYFPRCNMARGHVLIAEPHRERVEVEREADGGVGHDART